MRHPSKHIVDLSVAHKGLPLPRRNPLLPGSFISELHHHHRIMEILSRGCHGLGKLARRTRPAGDLDWKRLKLGYQR